MKRFCVKGIVGYLVFAVIVIGMVPKGYAGFSPSELIQGPSFDREADLGRIQKVLEMKLVVERLKVLGFTSEEIQNRLDRLTDAELHELALRLDEIRVGGDAGVVIVLLLVAILVVLILYLSGHELVLRRK